MNLLCAWSVFHDNFILMLATAINFQARQKVSEALIQEIGLLNSLDVELYKYGQYIFEKQQAHMTLNMMYDVS